MRKIVHIIALLIMTSAWVSLSGCRSEEFDRYIPDILKPDSIQDDTIVRDSTTIDTTIVDTVVVDTVVTDSVPGASDDNAGDVTSGDGTYSVLLRKNYTLAGVRKAFANTMMAGGEENAMMDNIMNWLNRNVSKDTVMTMVAIKYPTLDAQGKKVMASGVLYLPSNTKNIKEILIASHYTITHVKNSPSQESGMMMEALISASNPGTAVFASDYIGFGITADMVHPYLVEANAGQCQLDVARAGMEYLKDNSYTMDKTLKTYSVGFSQGGAVAVATQRAFEEDATAVDDFNFCGTYCGDGPYDPWATFEYYFEQGKAELPTVLPMTLMGMMSAYPDIFQGIEFKEYFSKKIDTAKLYNMIASKEYDIMTIDSAIKQMAGSNRLSDIMSQAALDTSSSINKALRIALDRNNLADGSWTPKHICVVYHARNDNVVPYVNSRSLKSAFPSDKFVDATPALRSNQHAVAAISYYMSMIMQNKYRVK